MARMPTPPVGSRRTSPSAGARRRASSAALCGRMCARSPRTSHCLGSIGSGSDLRGEKGGSSAPIKSERLTSSARTHTSGASRSTRHEGCSALTAAPSALLSARLSKSCWPARSEAMRKEGAEEGTGAACAASVRIADRQRSSLTLPMAAASTSPSSTSHRATTAKAACSTGADRALAASGSCRDATRMPRPPAEPNDSPFGAVGAGSALARSPNSLARASRATDSRPAVVRRA
mmetsp:Transcript_28513/g.89334  ORF Transcript_28513/g.89334 Transcript_28513/m.89334 type:complete len:234 (+) Transcript_28513:1077-1778(+)